MDQVLFYTRFDFLRQPLRLAQRLENACLAEDSLDGGNGAFAVAMPVDKGQCVVRHTSDQLAELRLRPNSLGAVVEKPGEDVVQEASVVALRQQSQRTGFKYVRAAKQRESSAPMPAHHGDGQ